MYLKLETMPVALARIDKSIYVATMDAMLTSFSVKGKKLFALKMPAAVSCMEVISVRRSKVAHALLVALDDGTVRVYSDKRHMHTVRRRFSTSHVWIPRD